MTAELHARITEDGKLEIDAEGETRHHVTLLAAYADAIAEASGGRAQGVLKRAQSRVITMRRQAEGRVVLSMGAAD